MKEEPQYVMNCPECRWGKVYRHKDRLECERCGATRPLKDND